MSVELVLSIGSLLGVYYSCLYFVYIKTCYIDTGRDLPW